MKRITLHGSLLVPAILIAMTFKEITLRTGQFLLGVIGLVLMVAFIGLLAKGIFKAFLLGWNVL